MLEMVPCALEPLSIFFQSVTHSGRLGMTLSTFITGNVHEPMS